MASSSVSMMSINTLHPAYPSVATGRPTVDRAKDSLGNRVSSGISGDFEIELFQTSASNGMGHGTGYPVVTGEAVYDRGGEYRAVYNVTAAGEYAMHVRRAVTYIRLKALHMKPTEETP